MLSEPSESGDFYSALKDELASCGYNIHQAGFFTKSATDEASDWISVSGNRFFYSVNVGVTFGKLNSQMAKAMPKQKGMAPLDGVSPSLIPFVFSPLSRYLTLPPRGRDIGDGRPLTTKDAIDLSQLLCGKLHQKLSKFHDINSAIEEVEATIGTGGAKIYLLVLAYIRTGKTDAAHKFARDALSVMKSDLQRSTYIQYLRNIGVEAV